MKQTFCINITLCNRFHQFLYNFREMRLLERVDFCGKSVGGVGRGDRTTELGNRRSRVDTFRHIVDGDAALRLAGGDNGAMHIHSPHSFASELRQQRWMHVDNPFGKGFQHFLRHHCEKSGKHHQVDCRVTHHSDCLLRIFASFSTRNDHRRHSIGLQPVDHRRLAVGNQQRHFRHI